jgi:hypothetical protein
MCGAYGFSVNNAKEVYDRFAIVNTLESLTPRWNVRPGQMNLLLSVRVQTRFPECFGV